jgi:hypothetical protein
VNEAMTWRLALAEEVGAAYASTDNARVVMIAGSVGRGSADRYSDIEVDVYYAEAPTEAERVAAVERCGGTVELLAEDEDEWEEQMTFGGFHTHTSTFLVETMDRYLREVVDDCSLSPAAQTRLFSLQHAVTVKGEEQVECWRAKAAAYPDGLQKAMLDENLDFARFGWAAEMFAARNDVLALYETLVETGRQLIGALLALNRIYAPMPGYLKWVDETIGLMTIKPTDLAARLTRSFQLEPQAAVREMAALIDETLALVETHVPAIDTAQRRADVARGRAPYDTMPARQR